LSFEQYRCPSPNFICCCPTGGRDGEDAQHANEKLTTDVLSVPPLSRDSIPDSVQFNPMQNELEFARKEIAMLKLQLSTMSG
jgi:hypothetical protein